MNEGYDEGRVAPILRLPTSLQPFIYWWASAGSACVDCGHLGPEYIGREFEVVPGV